MQTIILIVLVSIATSEALYRKDGPPLCGCKPDARQVCATNGKTYDSVCAMNCDYQYDYTTGKYVKQNNDILYYGKCPTSAAPLTPPTPIYPFDPPVTTTTPRPYNPYYPYNPDSVDRPPLCGCKPDARQVCATNGKTYNSVCAMNCDYDYEYATGRYVRQKNDILYYGVCPTSASTTTPAPYYPFNPYPDSPRSPPLCGCRPDGQKVCATNGKTYDSVCALNCDYNYDYIAGKYVRQNNEIMHYGECSSSSAPTTPPPYSPYVPYNLYAIPTYPPFPYPIDGSYNNYGIVSGVPTPPLATDDRPVPFPKTNSNYPYSYNYGPLKFPVAPAPEPVNDYDDDGMDGLISTPYKLPPKFPLPPVPTPYSMPTPKFPLPGPFVRSNVPKPKFV